MMKLTSVGRLLAVLGLTGLAYQTASASLTVSYQINGTGNRSIDGYGLGNKDNFVSALVPTGSTIEKAFLYSSTYGNGVTSPTVTFDGTLISSGAWTAGGLTGGANGLQAFRTDVTSLVTSKVGGGGGTFNFTLSEGANALATDGEVLAVVYSNPLEETRTIAFLDGFSATTGDSTALNLASPLTAAQLASPSFQALMSLGIGYSYQEGSAQYSTVDVNGKRLTSSAGGNDDGSPQNGGLITVGGLGDSPLNPPDPLLLGGTTVGGTYDDELYSLTPFLNAGDTSIKITTLNPSNDDNIFFAGFNLTARANVNQPPPSNVPDSGTTLGLFGFALLAIAAARRFVK